MTNGSSPWRIRAKTRRATRPIGGVAMSALRSDRRTNPYIQKIRVPARVSQPSQEPRDGSFLLFPGQARDQRGESLLELLNSDRTVIPFLQADDQNVLLLTRVNID